MAQDLDTQVRPIYENICMRDGDGDVAVAMVGHGGQAFHPGSVATNISSNNTTCAPSSKPSAPTSASVSIHALALAFASCSDVVAQKRFDLLGGLNLQQLAASISAWCILLYCVGVGVVASLWYAMVCTCS